MTEPIQPPNTSSITRQHFKSTTMMNQCISAATVSCSKIFDLIIIGGGLSGVLVAHDYHHRPSSSSSSSSTPLSSSLETEKEPSWRLFEARSVLGGRLANDDREHRIDLGGAWVWPHHQPNIRHLLSTLDVPTFVQPDDPSSDRIDGGAVAVVDKLYQDLPKDNIILNTPVTKCTLVKADIAAAARGGGGDDDDNDESRSSSIIQVETKSNTDEKTVYMAKRVVIAVPPKLISKHIAFDPPLSEPKSKAMEGHHTWMAGVTKVSLVYPTQFWKSGDGTNSINTNMGLPTHLGPAFQVYDASTKDGRVAAITFFALVPPDSPASAPSSEGDRALARLVSNQLAQIWKYFGYDDEIVKQLTESYTDVHVKRWPNETYISEDPRPQQIHPHPHPVPILSQSEWDGTLLFAGSEADLDSPGVMEGAVGSALRVLRHIP
jgi:monoamine oxidase